MPLNRRSFVAGTAATLGMTMGTKLNAKTQGSVMREKVSALLALLDDTQRDAALFSFTDPQRRAWNFMLGARPAPGLALEKMSPTQKEAALDLLGTGTSALGFEKAQNIMLQQDILRDEWQKGAADRNRERFCVQIYGTPDASAPWSWRWEGHHLSLTFTLIKDQVISTTPSAFSSEPNTVPSGPHRGLVVLKEEETLARALYSDLGATARKAALVWSRSPGNILSTRGAENQVAAQQAGVALGDLGQTKMDMVARLIEVYTHEVLPAALAERQRRQLAQEDMASIRFAWGGADLDGSIYYRITGKRLLIEFATLRNQPQHLHAVFHDIQQNFGQHQV